MQASVSVKGTETTTKKFDGAFPPFSTTYETSSAVIRGFKGKRNINVDNSINCRKTNIVDLGLYSCFREQQPIFLSGQSIICGGASNASADFGLGGKITWFVEVTLKGNIIKKREWSIDVQAPPDP